MSSFCPWCGAPVLVGHQYCGSCGRELSTSSGALGSGPLGPVAPQAPAAGSLDSAVQGSRSGARTVLLVAIALVVMAFVLYLVIETGDLTALLLGILILVFLYALARFSGGPRR